MTCLAPPSTRPTSTITPSSMATSAVRLAAPVPSTTVPPRITRSCISAPRSGRERGRQCGPSADGGPVRVLDDGIEIDLEVGQACQHRGDHLGELEPGEVRSDAAVD